MTIIKIVNIANGEIIERDMNELELDELETHQALLAAEQQAAKNKIAAKAALLEKLGITEDEAKLLLS